MESPEFPKKYNPRIVEEKWRRFWEAKGYFQASVKKGKGPYSMVMPPPNITGSLHMGHALNETLQDVLARWKRMEGCDVLWVPGTDHAGIATQNVVEKELAKEGLSREDLGREKFIERVWEWKKEYGERIIQQLKLLGSSCDWSRLRFTMDEGCSRAVREVFVRLFREGYIYRDNYIINWCPRCGTALSDLEVEYQEKADQLYYINYPVKGNNDQITVATTRPETMLGDVAVAVHPQDNRYKRFRNRVLTLPLVGREIPIITDERVDPSFGTGAVKVTPAHDPEDFKIGQVHGLPQVVVLDEKAKMTPETGRYAGMDRYTCREEVLKDLRKGGYLLKIEDYSHAVGHCYRCGTVIEPMVSKQWFVRMKELAQPAIKAVKRGEVKFFPPRWTKVYLDWINKIEDWCISRQIWWGHRIPVWYCKDCGHTNVSTEPPHLCESCKGSNLQQDPDVLDTWFSSALWPFSTLGWPQKTAELKYFYPTNTLVTGHEIIFLWVARMIMMGMKFMKKIPFRNVYIHGIVRDTQGRKMSKSLGNVIDPLVLIDKYGTDALRLALCQMTSWGGQDVFLAEGRLEGGRNFANKVWNAARFIIPHLETPFPKNISLKNLDLCRDDRFILTRLSQVIEQVTSHLESFKFNDAAVLLYNFTWHEFCDWYIELVKPRLYTRESSGAGEKGASLPDKQLAQYILYFVFNHLLRLLHPFMPFITEEIWNRLREVTGGEELPSTLMLTPWPLPFTEGTSPEVLDEVGIKFETTIAGRNIRSEWNLPPFEKVKFAIKPPGEKEEAILVEEKDSLKNLLNAGEIEIDRNLKMEGAPFSGVTPSGVVVYCYLDKRMDLEKEEIRLSRKMDKVMGEIKEVSKKLNNEEFLKKAPPRVIDKERRKLEEGKKMREKLRESLERIKLIRDSSSQSRQVEEKRKC